MRIFSFFLAGIFFGVVMTKSEAISWFRIHEMFRFESFHMYGIIGTAVIFSSLILWAMKKFKFKTLTDSYVQAYPKMDLRLRRHLIAGSIFGLGWALIGSCPGPIYVLLGNGYMIFLLVLLSAVFGTFVYGLVKDKIPH